MNVFSKLQVAKMMAVAVLKQHLNVKGGLLAGWVAIGSVLLVRGIRRDRQSSTAATTDRLLLQVREAKKQSESKPNTPPSSFYKRLRTIMKIICPGWYTKESWFLFFLSILLIGMFLFFFHCSSFIHSVYSKNRFQCFYC